MATVESIITRAFRKSKVYDGGEEPSAEDAADALIELQSMYEQWATTGLFGRIADYSTAADYEAEPNQRITTTASAVITLPDTVDRDDEELAPYDLAYVEVIDTVAQTVTRYIYENGDWVDITGLVLADEAPLSRRGEAGLSACLAAIIADEWGGQVGPTTMAQAAAFKRSIALKLGGDALKTAPDYF